MRHSLRAIRMRRWLLIGAGRAARQASQHQENGVADNKIDRDSVAEAAPGDGAQRPRSAAGAAQVTEVSPAAPMSNTSTAAPDAAPAGEPAPAPEAGASELETLAPETPRNGAASADGAPEPALSPQPTAPEDDLTPAAASDNGAAEAVSENALYARIAKLESDIERLSDRTLRAQADAQNIKRRAEQEMEKARKYALERFAGELLPVVDNLERALEAASGDDEAIKPIAEGVELTLKSFQDVLRKFQVEPVDPVGEPFDPQRHQAMSLIDNPDAEPNTVLAVMQKGYTLNERLLRPAMVVVSKAPAKG